MNKQQQLKLAKNLLAGVEQLLASLPDFSAAGIAQKRQIDKLCDARQGLRSTVESMEILTKA